MRVIDYLLKALRDAALFNPEVQVAPACILWPDHDCQWKAIIPRLQAELPELLVLGGYAPDKRTGPAIWMRCVIVGTTDDVLLPPNLTPVLYLPGVSRQDLRAVETCPEYLKPLAELQYRGVIWSQINAKDWTVLALLKTDQGGLGLDVAQTNDAKNAMQLALYRLLDEEVELLRGKRLDKDYFNTLLTGGDPIRDLLQWLDQEDTFQANRGENEWHAFLEVCKSQLAFDPQNEGGLAGAVNLAIHEGPWQAVWDRFCEAPKRYPNIPERIRQCQMAPLDLWSNQETHGGWPQWNEEQEKNLRRDLQILGNLPPQEAQKKLLEMEKQHGRRRKLVWAELGEAPLALALEPLAMLAETTKNGLAAGTVEDLAAGYCNNGWQADNAVLQTLAHIEQPTDFEAVTTAIRAVYLSWAEESAHHLQKIWNQEGMSGPGNGKHKEPRTKATVGKDCVLFVDGLRFDCGKQLVMRLEKAGCTVEEHTRWVPLPSVTGTGKPAVAPIRYGDHLAEELEGYNFTLLPSHQLRKEIEKNGWHVAEKKRSVYPEPGMMEGLWVEFGDIDHEGHDRGCKLARHITLMLTEVRDTITAILAAGWKRIRVVTDHGWLLLPGGLPKIELPAALVEHKWGRCASLKPGATTEEHLYPWFWNPGQHFVLADGISCFRKGEEYAHGGLSLQECLVLEFTVTSKIAVAGVLVEFTDVVWKGLRCTVAVDGNFVGLSLDIRLQPGNATSSVVVSVKPFKEHGTASVVVENGDLEGHQATLVLLDAHGSLVAQYATVVAGTAND